VGRLAQPEAGALPYETERSGWNVTHRVFLLSPANTGGLRAKMLLSETAGFELARRLRDSGAPLGEIYSFMSSLYFRGKVAYAQAFCMPPPGVPNAVVITPGFGLVPLETCLSTDQLRAIARVPVDEDNLSFREPLNRDAKLLDEYAGPACQFVLLGSIATEKYVTPLLEIFGERLVFPAEFVGRGDMSRGGLMLRAARSGTELTYVPVRGAVRHGPRPAKLAKLPRRNA